MSNDVAVFIPVASPLHDREAVRTVLREYLRVLEGAAKPYRLSRAGGLPTVLTDVESVRHTVREVLNRGTNAIVVGVMTGGSEELVLELAGTAGRDFPVALIAHRTQNSLAASVEALSRLRAEGFRAAQLFLLNEGVRGEVDAFLRAARARRALEGMKLLVIGEPSPWLVHSSVGWEHFARSLGVEPIKVGLEEVVERYSSITTEEVGGLLKRFEGVEARGVRGEDLIKSLRMYLALKGMLKEYGATALTIRCFDLLRYGVTACIALSMLNDEGFIAGCEGDVPATLSMATLSLISGSPSFMGNVAWVDKGEGTLLIAHCTAPVSMGRRYVLRTHFESGISVAVEAHPRRGEVVTLARLDGRSSTLRVGTGVILNDSPVTGNACRTQLLLRLRSAARLIEEPIGNHYAVVPGEWVGALKFFADFTGLRLDEL